MALESDRWRQHRSSIRISSRSCGQNPIVREKLSSKTVIFRAQRPRPGLDFFSYHVRLTPAIDPHALSWPHEAWQDVPPAVQFSVGNLSLFPCTRQQCLPIAGHRPSDSAYPHVILPTILSSQPQQMSFLETTIPRE